MKRKHLEPCLKSSSLKFLDPSRRGSSNYQSLPKALELQLIADMDAVEQEWIIEPPVYRYIRREDLENLLLQKFNKAITVYVS
jgi:hypothetical protein